MPTPLLESIPNFSEARRTDVVDAIVAEIQSVPAIRILDRHSDWDHNRTVVTYVGPPEAVAEAAFLAIAKAAELIDLNQHQGAHPRIGATDVVPFVPISGITMAETVALARQLGQRVGESLQIPVYLYEEAALRPERTNLENIRRGQYEGLKEAIAADPDREPDFGPTSLSTAGATVIGAREPLIAFNVYLSTDDVGIANKIARAVRHSSGGLRYVKAMGVMVEGRAQVSMNLTNYRRTPLARVVELIRREADRYGVQVHHSELVGLIPNKALVDAAIWYMQMDEFQPEQLLETRLFEAAADTGNESPLPESEIFLDALASGDPTPGGGSASAYGAAMAASLVAMVARVTLGKKKYAEVQDQAVQLVEVALNLQHLLKSAVEQDAAAFKGYIDARRLPQETEKQKAERSHAIQAATLHAAEIPLQVAGYALDVMRLALQAAQIGNVNAISDAGSAFNLAWAGLKGAGLNVRINLLGMETEAEPLRLLHALQELEAQAQILEVDLRETLQQRGGLALV